MKYSSREIGWPRILVLGLVILVGGCATQAPPGSGMRDQLQDYRIANVEVSFFDEVDLGSIFGTTIPRIDLETDEEFADRVAEAMESSIIEDVGSSLPGQQPVDLRVRIETMEIASGVGRALFASSSELTGVVALVEPSTDRTVAETVITAREEAMGGNLGALVNAAVAVTTSRVDNIVEEFSLEIKAWLEG